MTQKRMHRKKDKQTRMILHKCTAPNECGIRKKSANETTQQIQSEGK
jgi:hypothetical protein